MSLAQRADGRAHEPTRAAFIMETMGARQGCEDVTRVHLAQADGAHVDVNVAAACC
jgi:hypothetical protein